MKKYHHCVKFTYPLPFQTRIPKVDQHTGGHVKKGVHGDMNEKKHGKLLPLFFYIITLSVFWVDTSTLNFINYAFTLDYLARENMRLQEIMQTWKNTL